MSRREFQSGVVAGAQVDGGGCENLMDDRVQINLYCAPCRVYQWFMIQVAYGRRKRIGVERSIPKKLDIC